MAQGLSPTSYDHVLCYSHDHALYLSLSLAAASSTSRVAALHLVAWASVEEQGVPELQPEVHWQWKVVAEVGPVAVGMANSAGQDGLCTSARARAR
jgi:hypothetical protein